MKKPTTRTTTTTATALLLLLSTSTTTTKAQDTTTDCFSLQNSTTCSGFSNYYISLVGNVKRYPFLANVTDISSFDAQLVSYVNSDLFYLQQLGCSSSSSIPSTITYPRYSLTYMCESLIQDSLNSLPCNYQNQLSPPPLCQSTCFEWTNSIYSITNNNLNLCPNQVQTIDQINNLNSTCQYWSGLNATTNCISGIVNEPNYCGFNTLSNACQYCKLSTDNCCQLISGCQSLSTGAIIGITIGCLIFAGLIGAAFYWFCCIKKNRKRSGVISSYINGSGNNGYVLKQKVEHNEIGGGYESIAASSQKALVGNNRFMDSNISMEEHTNHHQEQPLISNINTETADTPQTLEEFYQVKHPYPSQMGDELGLHVGDIVCVAMNFDDGWALGFNVTTGLKGVFPVVCVTTVPEDLLEQLLYLVNNPEGDQTATTKTLVEDNSLNMQQICENLRRSISISSNKRSTIINNTLPTSELTHHNSIPRRTASIMKRHSYDYRESDSPTSPTLNTPFFPSQPEPALFHQHLHNNTNTNTTTNTNLPLPKIETIEMYRKNNRVSKLEEEEDFK